VNFSAHAAAGIVNEKREKFKTPNMGVSILNRGWELKDDPLWNMRKEVAPTHDKPDVLEVCWPDDSKKPTIPKLSRGFVVELVLDDKVTPAKQRVIVSSQTKVARTNSKDRPTHLDEIIAVQRGHYPTVTSPDLIVKEIERSIRNNEKIHMKYVRWRGFCPGVVETTQKRGTKFGLEYWKGVGGLVFLMLLFWGVIGTVVPAEVYGVLFFCFLIVHFYYSRPTWVEEVKPLDDERPGKTR